MSEASYWRCQPSTIRWHSSVIVIFYHYKVVYPASHSSPILDDLTKITHTEWFELTTRFWAKKIDITCFVFVLLCMSFPSFVLFDSSFSSSSSFERYATCAPSLHAQSVLVQFEWAQMDPNRSRSAHSKNPNSHVCQMIAIFSSSLQAAVVILERRTHSVKWKTLVSTHSWR